MSWTKIWFGRWSVFCMGMAALASSAGAARGGTLVFEFGGVITAVDDYGTGSLVGRLQVGDTFSGLYTFNPAVPDLFPEDPSIGLYESPVSSMVVTTGALVLLATPAPRYIRVYDGQGARDELEFGAEGFRSGGFLIDQVGVRLQDFTMTAFVTDALPSSLELTAFDEEQRDLFVFGSLPGVGAFKFFGEVTSFTVVPEPSTLCVSAALPLALRRRRTRRR